ncbi:MAG TPA: glycosyltransferase family 2 protein [Candidatus Eisenbacteria bacterium]|nr:glycosyltransferase family 2 protein [Candidatus Eisenbacteria bacterium]
MKWLFWTSFALLAYTYAGYPVWLWVRARLKPWPVRRGTVEPGISIVMVVRNESAVLAEKLENLLHIEYAPERCQIVVVSDGSDDGTEAILSTFKNEPRVRAVLRKASAGKAAGLNDALRFADGQILVFTDARQKIESDAVHCLVQNFAEPEVGAVSGELMLGNPAFGESGQGMGLYWKLEKRIRELESASGSVVGATGALYAVRRELVVEVPADTILDDVYIPMHVAQQGFRVLFDGRARAWDTPHLGADREFQRKVRTLTGNYQLLQLAPWLLRKRNPLRFEFISHKLMRLSAPLFLLGMLVSSGLAEGMFFRFLFWLQIVFYSFGLLPYLKLDLGPVSRLCDVAYTFVALNAAAVVAFANYATGNMRVWTQSGARREITT